MTRIKPHRAPTASDRCPLSLSSSSAINTHLHRLAPTTPILWDGLSPVRLGFVFVSFCIDTLSIIPHFLAFSRVVLMWIFFGCGLCHRGQGLSGVIVLVVEFRSDRSQELIRRRRPPCEQVRCGIAVTHSILKDDFCLLIFPVFLLLFWFGLVRFLFRYCLLLLLLLLSGCGNESRLSFLCKEKLIVLVTKRCDTTCCGCFVGDHVMKSLSILIETSGWDWWLDWKRFWKCFSVAAFEERLKYPRTGKSRSTKCLIASDSRLRKECPQILFDEGSFHCLLLSRVKGGRLYTPAGPCSSLSFLLMDCRS